MIQNLRMHREANALNLLPSLLPECTKSDLKTVRMTNNLQSNVVHTSIAVCNSFAALEEIVLASVWDKNMIRLLS